MDAGAFFRQPGAELRGQMRCGRISSCDAKGHTAQVEFFEQEGFVSHDLSILLTRPGDYSVYEKDALVLCLLVEGIQGFGFVLGALYSEKDTPPLNDSGARSLAGDDLRLGDPGATDKVALAPATKNEIQKVLDYAQGISAAITAGVPSPGLDGGAGLKSTIVAALPIAPTLNEPGAEKVKAK